MNDRSLLVLGASQYQLEIIQTAKALGYRVLTTDNVPHNPGHRLAHESFLVDTTDAPRVVALAKQKRPHAVIAACTDVAVTTAAEVAEALGLPGVPSKAARVLTSKILFRQFLASEGLPAPMFRPIEIGDIQDESLTVDGRTIIKPEGSSGSKGVFIIGDRRELLERLPATLSFSPTKRAIVEAYIEGAQGTCEGIVQNGRVVFAIFTDRATAPAPFVVTAGHFVPSRLPPATQARTLALIERVLAAHGVATSAFDCDFVVSSDAVPYLLELTPRLGGNSLTRLVRTATGIDLAEAAIRQAFGEKLSLSTDLAIAPTAQLVLGVPRAGRLRFDEAEATSLRAAPWVRDLTLDYPLGQQVEAFINGRTRVGEATLVAATRVELDARATELHARLALDVIS